MPENFGLILSKDELRDLVEYLTTLKERPVKELGPRALRDIRSEMNADDKSTQ